MIQVYIVDAFTSEMFQGNPAGVVILDEAISEERMQMLAKEINHAETAFLLKSNNPDYNYQVRYFTPSTEVDFCGHATVGLSWIVGSEIKDLETLKISTNIGIVSIDLLSTNNKLESVMMEQLPPQFKPFSGSIEEIFNLLGIDYLEYDEKSPVFYGYTGNWDLFIPVKTKKALEKAIPKLELLKKHNLKHRVTSVHLFTFDISSPYLLYTRNFGPAVGINEDYVTGSANGALCAYLAEKDMIKEKEFTILQGNIDIRCGEIKVMINDNKIRLGGKAIKVMSGNLKF